MLIVLLALLLGLCAGCISPQWNYCTYCHERKHPEYIRHDSKDMGDGITREVQWRGWVHYSKRVPQPDRNYEMEMETNNALFIVESEPLNMTECIEFFKQTRIHLRDHGDVLLKLTHHPWILLHLQFEHYWHTRLECRSRECRLAWRRALRPLSGPLN